jgi:hypothetical protein
VFSAVKAEYCRPGRRQASRDAKFLQIVEYLSKNARAQLTDMAKDLGIPKSTIFDYLKLVRERYTFTIKPKEAYPYDRRPG